MSRKARHKRRALQHDLARHQKSRLYSIRRKIRSIEERFDSIECRLDELEYAPCHPDCKCSICGG